MPAIATAWNTVSVRSLRFYDDISQVLQSEIVMAFNQKKNQMKARIYNTQKEKNSEEHLCLPLKDNEKHIWEEKKKKDISKSWDDLWFFLLFKTSLTYQNHQSSKPTLCSSGRRCMA